MIKLFDIESPHNIRTFTGHEGRINEVHFARNEQESFIFYTASSDSTIKLWDIRQNGCLDTFRKGGRECWSADMDSTATLIGSGQGSKVQVWDLRTRKLHGTYDDAHTDDVTQARFHPSLSQKLVTASVDGLICVIDTSTPDLDDALACVLSAGVSVGRIGFAGDAAQQLWCLSHVEGLQLWALGTEERLVHVDDARPALAAADQGRGVDYLLGCFYHRDSDNLYLLGGDDEGAAGAWLLTTRGPAAAGRLVDAAAGHRATVRTVDWDFGASKVRFRGRGRGP